MQNNATHYKTKAIHIQLLGIQNNATTRIQIQDKQLKIKYDVIPCHAIPYHTITHTQLTSLYITLHHITSHHNPSHHIASHRITSHHIASQHISLHEITFAYTHVHPCIIHASPMHHPCIIHSNITHASAYFYIILYIYITFHI